MTLLIGCITGERKKMLKIGFSQCTGRDLWRKTMLQEMKTELSLHDNVEFLYAEAAGDSKKQVEQARKLLKSGIDILIISPNESEPLDPIIKEAYQLDIPTIVIDRKTPSKLYTAYIGADNYQVGQMAGTYIGSRADKNINVFEIMGLAGSSPAIERHKGFVDAIKAYPKVKLTGNISGDWLKDVTKERLLKSEKKNSTVNCIFAHNDDMAIGAREVFQIVNDLSDFEIVGVDALPGKGGGMEMVSSGLLSASVLYPTCGREAINTAFAIFEKKHYQRENILKSIIIDATNVKPMELQYNKIKGQQKDIERQKSILSELRQIYKSQQSTLNIVIVLLVATIVLGGLFFLSWKENRRVNETLVAKNIEIQDQKNQLIEMASKAEIATEGRLNFYTNISHEFRTPLTLLLSPLSEVLAKEKLSESASKNLHLVKKSTYRLLNLVNQLLDFRKIEIDKQKVSASENNIVAYISEIVEQFKSYASEHEIEILFFSSSRKLLVWYDDNMLDKVFYNLIVNAIKCSPRRSQIVVKLSVEDDKELLISVKDIGMGISAEDVPNIFNQFYQADNAPINGSGIGLSLSKEIVELHHGRIEVTSNYRLGTTFTVRLHLGNQHFEEHEVTAKKIKPVNSSLFNIYQGETSNANYSIESKSNEQSKTSVLIIEDNQALLEYLKDHLSETFEVITAENGNDALSIVYNLVPDVIISDVVLPGYSGKEITRIIKSDFRVSHIPIILLTAQATTLQHISGLETLADMYLSKPFEIDVLIASVTNLHTNRNILRKYYTSELNPINGRKSINMIEKQFVADFSEIIEKNIDNENFIVEDICKAMGISRMQLHRKVKAILDSNVSDFILSKRLKKAKQLLLNENLTISEITYLVGFSSPNYFSTVFKSKFGISPSEFKKDAHISGNT
jgi:signal transduction histidine kinase/ABC-type sugar transport system substrate-binding protein/AraC-like DNA-binding protein